MRITRHPRDEFSDEDQDHSPGKQLVFNAGWPATRASGSTATTLSGDKILRLI